MNISSRTPEGRPNHCPVCHSDLRIEPSDPAGDAPCPRCGHLLWFAREGSEDVQVIKLTLHGSHAESWDDLIDSVAMQPGMRLVIDFGDVPYLPSAALGRLIQLKKRLGIVGGRLGLRNIHPDLAEVFRITRLDQVFQ